MGDGCATPPIPDLGSGIVKHERVVKKPTGRPERQLRVVAGEDGIRFGVPRVRAALRVSSSKR